MLLPDKPDRGQELFLLSRLAEKTDSPAGQAGRGVFCEKWDSRIRFTNISSPSGLPRRDDDWSASDNSLLFYVSVRACPGGTTTFELDTTQEVTVNEGLSCSVVAPPGQARTEA